MKSEEHSPNSASHLSLFRLEKEKGIVIRFILGNSKDEKEQRLLAGEEKEHKDILRLPITVHLMSVRFKRRFRNRIMV